ncbi:putative thioester dehydrase [Geobacillus thermoleovorans CCB_US3_UF5]|jgi:3-hydroxyacyl-[acyl-carrier-protein] dehydratase|uniref:Thioester dehydrase n=1 Tax=Geobacillus thermoleovorans CCB_US3_UF5 TaxID=1111068 RepID=A0ABN3ZUG3_GEOTH|nr:MULTISPECIES: 3-hydroxyacyl-ACP dehydratase FabZ family protein [Bacillaceae]AEV19302.1 putative thioester dehydrase [Geobacillus thermoleovorans CCB_US3_UF5]NNU95806.1 beta-hydroxyacyl-ACP dehydratase [Anoxybacillus sp. EFIL]QDY73377.1 beta-hydroxyacyl-ACP dehydratase [Geobacillus thermoleovorans]
MVTVLKQVDVTTLKPMDMLLQQPPFLFVDKIVDYDGETIVCSKMLAHNEPFFSGHFPNNPVMPGVLLIEMAAQASLLLTMLQQDQVTPLKGYLVKTENFSFLSVSEPGDELLAKVKIVKQIGSYHTAQATIRRAKDNKKVAKGQLIFYLPEGGES